MTFPITFSFAGGTKRVDINLVYTYNPKLGNTYKQLKFINHFLKSILKNIILYIFWVEKEFEK